MLAGSYSNVINVFDVNGDRDVQIPADKNAFKAKNVGTVKTRSAQGRHGRSEDVNIHAIDFNKKVLHASWHPRENTVAVAATNNLFIFSM